ncbi:MAG: hypothetical protein K1W18_14120 [Oscillospiraceae bacterium]
MYAVSDAYKQAVTGDAREFKIRANIYFRDKTIQMFDDSTIENEVTIESQMMAGSPSDDTIDIGAATSKKLTMTVRNDKTDLRRFAGARLWLYVSLRLENGAFEDVPMGKFFINNKSVSRVGDQVTFSAYDGMILLHYELTSEMRAELKGKTALEAAQILCGGRLAVVPPKSPAGEEVTLPNSNLELDFDSEQIETARDGIMWIAQLMGCFARVNRLGQLEFVQIKSWWKMYTETTGTILAVRNIQGDQRFKTKFADDRIHIVGVSMRGADNKLVTQRYGYSHENEEDPTSDVTVEMATNPLIISSDKPLSEILGNILAELSTAYFYSFSTEMANDPALDAGDTIRLKGGVINGTNHNNDLIGFITHNVWRYRGHQEITNASSVPIVFDGGDSESGTPARSRARSASAARSDDDLNFLPPKPQSEKALQGRDSATKLVGNFGKQYVFKWTNPYYLEAFDGNGKEMFKLSVLPFSVEKGNSHITLGNDYIEIKNAETRGREFSFYIHENGQTRITDSSGNDVFSIVPAGGLMEYKVGSQSFQVWLNTGEIKMNGKTVWAPWMA